MLALIGGMTACDDQLDVQNPNNQTTYDFGDSESELQGGYHCVLQPYTPRRYICPRWLHLGCRTWRRSLELIATVVFGVRQPQFSGYHRYWRRVAMARQLPCGEPHQLCIIESRCVEMSEASYNQIAGQAFSSDLWHTINLATYYQTVPLITDYASYSDINTMYASNNTQDEVFDQIEADLTKAMQMLPSRDAGGEWAKGRATCGAAAGYLARALHVPS
jgi:starch-binding outer membrane protein, SusD/RagB family